MKADHGDEINFVFGSSSGHPGDYSPDSINRGGALLRSLRSDYPHCLDEEAEAQRGEGTMSTV